MDKHSIVSLVIFKMVLFEIIRQGRPVKVISHDVVFALEFVPTKHPAICDSDEDEPDIIDYDNGEIMIIYHHGEKRENDIYLECTIVDFQKSSDNFKEAKRIEKETWPRRDVQSSNAILIRCVFEVFDYNTS